MYNHQFWTEETDPKTLLERFQNHLVKSGFKILDFTEFHFSPYGYTALFLLGESHLAIHTFPEEKKSYIELSSCVKSKYLLFLKFLEE